LPQAGVRAGGDPLRAGGPRRSGRQGPGDRLVAGPGAGVDPALAPRRDRALLWRQRPGGEPRLPRLDAPGPLVRAARGLGPLALLRVAALPAGLDRRPGGRRRAVAVRCAWATREPCQPRTTSGRRRPRPPALRRRW